MILFISEQFQRLEEKEWSVRFQWEYGNKNQNLQRSNVIRNLLVDGIRKFLFSHMIWRKKKDHRCIFMRSLQIWRQKRYWQESIRFLGSGRMEDISLTSIRKMNLEIDQNNSTKRLVLWIRIIQRFLSAIKIQDQKF